MKKNIYKCKCGKEFNSSQAINGHKSQCIIHLGQKRHMHRKDAEKEVNKKKSETWKIKILENPEHFIKGSIRQCVQCSSEFKIKTNYNKKYCSVKCANLDRSLISESTKNKISNSLKGRMRPNKTRYAILRYNANPRVCKICEKVISYNCRHRLTCSDECLKESLKTSNKRIKGQYTEGRHIVYKTTNLLDGRYYIGVRKTEVEFDGYLGSGLHLKRMVKKYGKENFLRETLFEFSNSKDAYDKEISLLKEHLDNANCVNISHGGFGGRTH